MPKRTRQERVETRVRLLLEDLIPVELAAVMLSLPPPRVLRLATRGIGGFRLDAVPRGGFWLTSREAVARFLSATRKGGAA